MINNIFVFLFVLSTVYILRFVVEFIFQLTQETPKTIELSNIEKVIFYIVVLLLSMTKIVQFLTPMGDGSNITLN